jgi:hypothetical protein
MKRKFPSMVFIIAALLTACGGEAQKEAQQTTETLVSWNASLDLLGQQWTEHRVPETYVRQMLKAAKRTLEQERQESAKAAASGVGTAESAAKKLESNINRLEKTLTQAATAGP